MKKSVYLPLDMAQAGKQYLLNRGYEVIVGTNDQPETIIRESKKATALIVRLTDFPKPLIEQLGDVKIIARHGVGVDNIDLQAAKKRGIVVTNTPLANASSVAETAVTLLLALVKKVIPANAHMRAGDTEFKNDNKGMDIEGKTLGIIGYGKIGQEFAKKMAGFGMEILIFDPFATESLYGKIVTREEIIERADIISLHLPATPATKGSFGQKEFAKMKKTAYFINTARGSIVDEPALIDALKNGAIAGAALDVYSKEPLPLDNPLYQFNNVILTPHIASNTVETMERMALHAATEVHRVLSGKEPKWQVNK